MADDPVPRTNAYVDPYNVAFEQQLKSLAGGKPLTSLSVAQIRSLLNKAQAHKSDPRITSTHFTVPTSNGDVKTFVFRPKDAQEDLPFVYHLHGGGFVVGNAFDYEPFIAQIIARTGRVAVVFPEYTLAPTKQFPVQLKQTVEVLQYVIKHGKSKGLKTDKAVISGDSAGGPLEPMGRPRQSDQHLSDFEFQDNVFLSQAIVQEFQAAYTPNADDRKKITASPLLMTVAQAKEFMPATTILTSEVDVLRDEGKNFAKLLQTAGVECGVIQAVAELHDPLLPIKTLASPTSQLVLAAIAGKLREVLLDTRYTKPNGIKLHEDDAEEEEPTAKTKKMNGRPVKRRRRL